MSSGYPRDPLHEIEDTLGGNQTEVAALGQLLGTFRIERELVLREVTHSKLPRVERLEQDGQPAQILRIGRGADVEVVGEALDAVCDDRQPSDHDVLDSGLVKVPQEGAGVERSVGHLPPDVFERPLYLEPQGDERGPLLDVLTDALASVDQ